MGNEHGMRKNKTDETIKNAEYSNTAINFSMTTQLFFSMLLEYLPEYAPKPA